MLSFVFTNLDSLYESLSHPQHHSAIILTSPRAVEAVTKAIQVHDKDKGEYADGFLSQSL